MFDNTHIGPASESLTAYRVTKPCGDELLCLYGRTSTQRLGLVVMPPGYERRIHHYSVFAEYLMRHGFDVLRFDLSNHIGLSDGEIVNFTMSSLADDIVAVLNHTSTTSLAPVCLVGTSLAARASLRAATLVEESERDQVVGNLVMVLPVVDVEGTTTAAIGRNIVEEWRTGVVSDPTLVGRVLSHDVAWAFAQDACNADWAGLTSTRRELSRLQADAFALAAAEDSWVCVDDVQAAFGEPAPGGREIVVLEAASHELSTKAPVMRLVMEELISWLWRQHGHSGEVTHLEFQDIMAVMDAERALKHEQYERITEGTR